MLLEIKELAVHYEKVEALKGVSLNVEEGQIVTLIGANGAGKSTTLRTISGLKSPTRGEIWFQGRRIDKLPPQDVVKDGISHCPEGRRVFPFMTVSENLMMGAYTRKDKAGIKQSLERVYHHFPVLKERTRQAGGTLSGGEQQMLAMGRALMAKPKLMLLDEPSLGLSPLLVKEIAKIITEIHAEGVSIILVEQNAIMALRLAHKGYVLEVGKIALEGTGKELLDNPHVKAAYLGG